jgi:hypothetical protein
MHQGGLAQLQHNLSSVQPTPEEVERMGEYLGIAPEEHPYIWEVSELALSAPLLEGWVEEKQDDGTSLFA